MVDSRFLVPKSRDHHPVVYYYRIERMFGGGKLWRISHQKLLASKSLANLASFAFLIVHTIDNLDYRRANVN